MVKTKLSYKNKTFENEYDVLTAKQATAIWKGTRGATATFLAVYGGICGLASRAILKSDIKTIYKIVPMGVLAHETITSADSLVKLFKDFKFEVEDVSSDEPISVDEEEPKTEEEPAE